MTKSYLLVYNNELGTRDAVKTAVDSIPIIKTWRYDMPNMFYLISDYSAKEVSVELRKHLLVGRFIVLEYTANSYGWLDADSWHLLQKKSHKEK